MKNRLPDFYIFWKEERAVLIDSERKVCLGVSKLLAENLDTPQVQEKLYPIWKRQTELQKRREEQRGKINTVYLIVTRKCNMDCDFCSIDASKDINTEKELTLSDIKEKIVPFLKKISPHKLVVTGGEPLIKDKIVEIVKELHNGLKCSITLQSNGLVIDESIVGKLKGSITEIDFSTKHMLSMKRGEELQKNIELCKSVGIQVVLSFIFEKMDKDCLHKVIDIAAKYDTGLLVNVVSPVGRAKDNSDLLSDYERIEMDLDIAEYIYEKHIDEKKIMSLIEQKVQVRNSCGGYGKVMAVFPEGNIYMCQCLEKDQYGMGNILVNSPEQVSEKLERMLQQDYIMRTFCTDEKKVCKQCEYRYLCGGKCPVSEAKDDFTCYYVKKMIDYQLFYKKENEMPRETQQRYINYLKKIRDDFQSKEGKVH